MLKLLILQHHVAEGPGIIHQWIEQQQHQSTVFLVPEGKTLPEPEAFDALIILGGPWCTFSDDAPRWLQLEKHWIENCVRRKKPIFAICMGAQLLASALGAEVERMPQPETGWQSVSNALTNQTISVLQWHEDYFSIPDNTELFMIGRRHRHQAFKNDDGSLIGIQFHAEWTQKIIDNLHAAFGNECPLPKILDRETLIPMHAWLLQQLSIWQNSIHAINSHVAKAQQSQR